MAKLRALKNVEITKRLRALRGWKLQGDAIARTFPFENYYQTIAFVNAVAWIANRQDHHPDLEVGFNNCKVSYSTHDVGGISAADFLAAIGVNSLFDK